jgi:hypothetical protein
MYILLLDIIHKNDVNESRIYFTNYYNTEFMIIYETALMLPRFRIAYGYHINNFMVGFLLLFI